MVPLWVVIGAGGLLLAGALAVVIWWPGYGHRGGDRDRRPYPRLYDPDGRRPWECSACNDRRDVSCRRCG